jgi:type II secretory pathway pseudopilin PulG
LDLGLGVQDVQPEATSRALRRDLRSGGARRSARALTLLEVIISIALIAMLLSALLTFFWQTLAARDAAAHQADRTQIVQQMLSRMASELRASVGLDEVGFPVQRFAGERRKITFLTAPLPAAESYAFYRPSQVQPLPQFDLREVTYELWVDPEETTEDGQPLVGGILRTERRALTPSIKEEELPEDERDILYQRRDLWSHELGYLEFRYFDGVEWSTSFQVEQGNPLPQLVQITVGFDSIQKDEWEDQDLESYPLDQFPFGPDVPNDNHYATIVRLPAADQMYSSRMQRLGNQGEDVYQFLSGAPAGPGGGGAQVPAGGTPGGKK